MKSFFKNTLTYFSILVISFLPFSYHYLNIQEKITNFIFTDFVFFLSAKLGKTNLEYTSFSSDSYSMYILVFLLFLLALILVLVSLKLSILKKYQYGIQSFSKALMTYYLVFHLANYGFSKLFKGQFYLPEPNILFTNFGNLDKDILYWSTIGVSYSYNIFLGSLEVLAALLIFFRRTRIIGLLLAVSIFIQIVAINFSFDISVKLFSIILLLFSISLLAPNLKNIVLFLLKKEAIQLHEEKTLFINKTLSISLKSLFIIFLISQVLLPNFLQNNFNDDKQERPFLHGAYEVINTKGSPLKKIFFHRDNYLIVQYEDESMLDFKAHIDAKKQEIYILDYDLNTFTIPYVLNKDSNELKIEIEGEWITTEVVNWKKLPVLQNNFQWMIDH